MASSKSNGLDPSDWARAPVNSGPAWLRCLKIIYNPEDKSVFGRTAKRWGILVVFYAVFYAVLAALFAACMGGLHASLDKRKPTWTLEKSLLGPSPGLSCRPLRLDMTPIVYDRNNDTSFYKKQLDDFFKQNVSGNAGRSECVADENYGYPDNPCFFIKLNKLYDWVPQYYEQGSLPEDMPEDLIAFINERNTAEYYEQGSLPEDMPEDLIAFINERNTAELDKIWISCVEEKRKEGQNATLITYPWGRGLPGTFYPYRNQEGYRSPIVAVKLSPPVNTDVVVRCRAWAKNIIYEGSLKEPRGYVLIQLHVQDLTD